MIKPDKQEQMQGHVKNMDVLRHTQTTTEWSQDNIRRCHGHSGHVWGCSAEQLSKCPVFGHAPGSNNWLPWYFSHFATNGDI